ncbi:MAG: TetR/AcrR family transcriptional regulator, tetracycline repressor protein [Acidimicrobiaceae bacterium]
MGRRTARDVHEGTVALSDAQILKAAKRIIAEVGVDGLTMRRLHDELGVALGATYYYVPTKHDLLVKVGTDLYTDIELPDADEVGWEQWVRSMMTQLVASVSAYPGMAAYLMNHFVEVFPADLNGRMIDVLTKAGFSPGSTIRVMTALTFFGAGASAIGVPDAPAAGFAELDAAKLFADGLDLILSGARLLLEEDRPAAKRKLRRTR